MNGRINRLERLLGHGPCPQCGDDGLPATFAIVVREAGDEPDGPEHCPACGRLRWFTLRIDNPRGEDET